MKSTIAASRPSGSVASTGQGEKVAIQPKLILALGRFAAQSLLNTEVAIGKLRGQVHNYQGVPLVVTYHPAYLLRNMADKARAWEDLLLARETMRRLQNGAPPTS